MSEVHEGGCLCGSIRYRTTGTPRRVLVCHCKFCQRFTGTAFLAEGIFSKSDTEISGGPFNTYTHRSDESGRALNLQFCPKCGTTFGMTLEWYPDVQTFSLGTFDDPNWTTPERHIFTRSAFHWMTYPPNVELHEKHFM